MENFKLTYAAFLFPAIPLMMLTFGNRWIAISKLIRQMHSDFMDKKSRSESAEKYLTQIKILSLRLNYVKYMQLLSGLAFILNLFTILFGMMGFEYAVFFILLGINIIFYGSWCIYNRD